MLTRRKEDQVSKVAAPTPQKTLALRLQGWQGGLGGAPLSGRCALLLRCWDLSHQLKICKAVQSLKARNAKLWI